MVVSETLMADAQASFVIGEWDDAVPGLIAGGPGRAGEGQPASGVAIARLQAPHRVLVGNLVLLSGVSRQADRVVVLGAMRAPATDTGSTYDNEWAMVWTLRDGKVAG